MQAKMLRLSVTYKPVFPRMCRYRAIPHAPRAPAAATAAPKRIVSPAARRRMAAEQRKCSAVVQLAQAAATTPGTARRGYRKLSSQ